MLMLKSIFFGWLLMLNNGFLTLMIAASDMGLVFCDDSDL